MAWNQRSKIVAMAVAIQPAVGSFVQPSAATDLIAVSAPTNSVEPLTAEDPTATGTVWDANPVYIGKQATVGCTFPLRGPGGSTPPASNAWVPGRFLQASGYAEIRKATANTGSLAAAATATTLPLANSESSVNDFLVGAPIQQASLGSGFKQTTLIADYDGATKTAILAETVGSPAASGASYTIPAFMSYVLGTLTANPPVLSISVWRDKKRYDYKDWAPASNAINIPVGNEANTGFPDMTVSGRATVVGVFDDTTPTLPTSMLAIPIPPARNGKFYLDRVRLGHQNLSFTMNANLGAASNQNAASGQDSYDILSGSRQTALDLNQMAVSDFDLHSREDSRVPMPVMSTWGMGPGNNFGFIQPNVVLDPFSPGDRGGYVSLTGNASTVDTDKATALTIWW